MIYDDYIEYTKKYKEEYGPLTVVFIEVGSFWELYNCDQNLGADMKTIADILNIQVSKKNKNIPEISAHNPLMAGFPSYCLSKFIPLLLNEQYTIVLVGQVTPPPNPKREVTKIISKSTSLDMAIQDHTNILCSIYIEDHLHALHALHKQYIIGLTMIDISTGKSNLFELSSTPHDTFYPFDEAYHQIIAFKPCEYILNGTIASLSIDEILDKLHIKNSHYHNFINIRTKPNIPINDHNNTLHKIFPDHGMLTPVEYLMLERNSIALNSYTYSIDFAYKHDELIVKKAQKPVLQWDNNDLNLSHNCIEQLDLYGLENILNRCATSFGKRAFRYRLLNPTFNIKQLQAYYDEIQTTLDHYNLRDLDKISQTLKQTYDIEKLFRRFDLLIIKPNELANLIASLDIINKICQDNDFSYIFSNSVSESIKTFINSIKNQLDMAECAKYSDTNDVSFASIFQKGIFKDIDKFQQDLDYLNKQSDEIINSLNAKNNTPFYKLEQSDRDQNMYITVTKKRYNKEFIATILEEHSVSSIGTNTCYKITSPILTDLYKRSQNHITKIRSLTSTYFVQIIKSYVLYNTSIITSSCGLDVNITCARNALEFGYSSPLLYGNHTNSCFASQAMRHPIIERLKSLKCDYVPNDINISNKGILLYGLNAVGKSTLMKATALNIIMAQSGMFVACKKLEYSPYQSIFTRITMRDDIYSGQSTFMVEISELRNILARADKNSLVIGDEICNGTESCSARAIVTSMIHFLQAKEVSFIFATHLHDLPFNKIPNITVCHLHVEFDESTNTLIYDRKIRPGQGMRTYGIEVCKALQMPNEFITMANEIRRDSVSLLNIAKSRYNAQIHVDNCKICGNQVKENLESHHIREQHTSDENGMINNQHKNHHNNLVVLCDSCHDKVHSGQLSIKGYVQTSEGMKLDFAHSSANNDNTIENQIIDLRRKNNSIQSIANQVGKTPYFINKVLKKKSALE